MKSQDIYGDVLKEKSTAVQLSQSCFIFIFKKVVKKLKYWCFFVRLIASSMLFFKAWEMLAAYDF